MNILLVTPMPPRPQAPGAIPVVLDALLSALRQRHTVTLLTVAGPEPDEAEAVQRLMAAGVRVRAAIRAEPRGAARWQRRWRLGTRWLAGLWPWRTAWFWDAHIQQLLDDELRQRPYDLIQVEDNAMGVYRYPAGIPTVFTEHEVRRARALAWPAGPRGLFSELDWQRWPRYQRQVWRKFDRLQVFTPRDAAELARLAPELAGRVTVNPFGIELPRFDPDVPEDGDSLLFVGNYTHAPNVDAALWLGGEIFPRIRARRPDAHLALVGIFPPAAVRALAGAGVRVTGAVPDIGPYFQQAAVCLAPIRTGGGLRTKVLLAMAFGKAVVTTPRGAEGLAYRGAQAPVLIAEDAAGLARCAADLLADPARRRALGQAARAYVAEHFSPSAYLARLEAVYAGLGLAARSAVMRPSRPTTALAHAHLADDDPHA